MTWHDMTWHFIPLHCIPLHCIPLHYITLHSITLHYIALHHITYITLHYMTWHCIAMQYTALHYIELHYITLHDVTWLYMTLHDITYLPTCMHACIHICIWSFPKMRVPLNHPSWMGLSNINHPITLGYLHCRKPPGTPGHATSPSSPLRLLWHPPALRRLWRLRLRPLNWLPARFLALETDHMSLSFWEENILDNFKFVTSWYNSIL